jgi:hypothetical protein
VEPEDLEPEPEGEKLGSLAQKARGGNLNAARVILIILAVFLLGQAAYYMVDWSAGKLQGPRGLVEKLVQKEIGPGAVLPPAQMDQLVMFFTLLLAFDIAVGGLFLLFGLLITVIPVIATISSLVLYLVQQAILLYLNPAMVGSGFLFKILIIIALVKAIQAAFAYEKERRDQAEFASED